MLQYKEKTMFTHYIAHYFLQIKFAKHRAWTDATPRSIQHVLGGQRILEDSRVHIKCIGTAES
jgi:hypothetical protein